MVAGVGLPPRFSCTCGAGAHVEVRQEETQREGRRSQRASPRTRQHRAEAAKKPGPGR